MLSYIVSRVKKGDGDSNLLNFETITFSCAVTPKIRPTPQPLARMLVGSYSLGCMVVPPIFEDPSTK